MELACLLFDSHALTSNLSSYLFLSELKNSKKPVSNKDEPAESDEEDDGEEDDESADESNSEDEDMAEKDQGSSEDGTSKQRCWDLFFFLNCSWTTGVSLSTQRTYERTRQPPSALVRDTRDWRRKEPSHLRVANPRDRRFSRAIVCASRSIIPEQKERLLFLLLPLTVYLFCRYLFVCLFFLC